jgi:hypothetical protein
MPWYTRSISFCTHCPEAWPVLIKVSFNIHLLGILMLP